MNSPIRIIEGLTVTRSNTVYDYVQLSFGKEIGISIYNEINISLESISVAVLVGRVVTTVTDHENAIEIKFFDGTQLTIDMHRQAYRGPEALELHRYGHPPVIWN